MRTTLARFSKIALPVALALPAGWLALDRPDASAAVVRERAAPSATALELGGTPVGTLRSALGGEAVGVVASSGAKGGLPSKQVTGVSYEELQLELDLSLERPVYDWIAAAFAGSAPRQSGTLVRLDPSGNAKAARSFEQAFITEIAFPALDAASKEAGYIQLVLAPARVSAAAAAAKAARPAARAKSWLVSGFKLEIDGLDTSRVSRIEPIVFRQPLASAGVGAARAANGEPGAIQLENLRVTLAEAGADAWRKWHEELVLEGKSSDKGERSGRLALLGPNPKDELARLELSNLGLIALRSKPTASGTSQLEAELYVERISFSAGSK